MISVHDSKHYHCFVILSSQFETEITHALPSIRGVTQISERIKDGDFELVLGFDAGVSDATNDILERVENGAVRRHCPGHSLEVVACPVAVFSNLGKQHFMENLVETVDAMFLVDGIRKDGIRNSH